MNGSTKDNYTCTEFADAYKDPTNNTWVVVFFAVVYVLIFILGGGGNAVIVYATMKHRSLQTVQNIFILNLGVSDVILCLTSLPITPVTNIYKQWYFGSLMCHIFPSIQAVGVFIGTFSLAAIAVERYFKLVAAPAHSLGRRRAFLITSIMWLVSISMTIPYAYHMRLTLYDGICGQFCSERWPSAFSRRIYTLVVLVVQFVIPFIVMAVCYWAVFASLKERAQSRLQSIAERSNLLDFLVATANGAANDQRKHLVAQRKRVQQQKRRVTVILVSMVVIFAATWLPHNIVSLVMEYNENLSLFHLADRTDLSYLVNLFTHSIAMTNSIANPVLYAFLNPEFRDLMVSSICWKAIRNAPTLSTSYSAVPQTDKTDRV
uniref:G-protein coupled receptors family 1 profile domain-containing protein n=1 Tax=Plectus sambesii TaxID=2011161 RepID=A0A914V301_9BILA